MIKKFFGKGDVFINAVSDIVLQGKPYKKGDTISFFENVDVVLDYDLNHKEGQSRGRQLSYVETTPFSLSISGIKNGADLERIMYKGYKVGNISYKEIKTIKFPNLVEYLNISSIPAKIDAYANGDLIEFDFNEEDLAITFEKEYDEVRLILYYEKEGKIYDFDKPNIGYVEIDVTINGRFGEEDGTFAAKLPLADLITEPMTVLTDTSNYVTSLSFALVNNQKPVMSYVEE